MTSVDCFVVPLIGTVHSLATLFRFTHKLAQCVLRNVSQTFLTREDESGKRATE